MGGRGTFAIGNNVAYDYETVDKIEDVKVLRGVRGKHSLPEEAHSSSSYIKLKPDGTFHEMRFYDKNHYLNFEIAYHQEKSLGSGHKPILHYHTYDKNFNRSKAVKATKAMYRRYKKYLKGVKK